MPVTPISDLDDFTIKSDAMYTFAVEMQVNPLLPPVALQKVELFQKDKVLSTVFVPLSKKLNQLI
eukprot:12127774-Ditylum_brightwellii.AAC.1